MKALKIIGIVLCCLITLCISVNVESWRRAKVDRQTTSRVQTAACILDLYVAILETESGQRGYIITGNVLDAEDYYSGIDRVRASREKLNVFLKATGENPKQASQLKDFDTILKPKLAEMASTIDAVHDHGPAAGAAIVKNQQGLRMMKRIKELKDALIESTTDPSGDTDGR